MQGGDIGEREKAAVVTNQRCSCFRLTHQRQHLRSCDDFLGKKDDAKGEHVMKKILVVVFVVVLFLPSVVLAQKIGVTLPSLEYPFFADLQKNVMEEAEKLGVEVIASDARGDVASQMAIVEDFIAKGVNGVMMWPIDQHALVPAVKALNEAGIPVATIGQRVTAGEILVHFETYYVDVGSVAGGYLHFKLDGRGNVAVLEGTPGDAAFVDMYAGFTEALKTSDIKILARYEAESPEKAYATMESLLVQYPDLQGVFIEGNYMIPGVVQALKDAGAVSKVATIGHGATPEALKYIEEGVLNATVEDFPEGQASAGLQFLVDYIKKGIRPSSKEFYLPAAVITKDTCPNCYPRRPRPPRPPGPRFR